MYTFITVDDEAYIHQGLDALMDWVGLGYKRVGLAQNGSEGFDIVDALRPDVVITDIRMPVVDGLEMIKRIGNLADYDPRFIVISGYSEFKYAKQAMQYGVQHYILKPIEEDELANSLATIKKRDGSRWGVTTADNGSKQGGEESDLETTCEEETE